MKRETKMKKTYLSRRELFVDEFLIDATANVEQQVVQPDPGDVVLNHNDPEGATPSGSGYYHTVFKDGDKYRMWYRITGIADDELTAYAESDDGIHWKRPDLGLFEVNGSTKNNIVWRATNERGISNLTVFKDPTEGPESDELYKAVGGRGHDRGGSIDQPGLYALKSNDGINWSLLQDGPIHTQEWGRLDTHNIAFWDPNIEKYRSYTRYFTGDAPFPRSGGYSGLRAIQVSTSDDFRNWSDPVPLSYDEEQSKHYYTNEIRPYPRAPHLYIGFPAWFFGPETEPRFMASRDGQDFRMWDEPFIPTSASRGRDGNRSNYIAYGLVKLPADDDTYTLYASESRGARLRRFTIRVDGFVKVAAPPEGGELLTKPLRFDGSSLVVNYETGNEGQISVELLQPDGQPYDGFSEAECEPLSGDQIDGEVEWTGNRSVADLAGKPVRLRFKLKDADLYSFQFTTKE